MDPSEFYEDDDGINSDDYEKWSERRENSTHQESQADPLREAMLGKDWETVKGFLHEMTPLDFAGFASALEAFGELDLLAALYLHLLSAGDPLAGSLRHGVEESVNDMWEVLPVVKPYDVQLAIEWGGEEKYDLIAGFLLDKVDPERAGQILGYLLGKYDQVAPNVLLAMWTKNQSATTRVVYEMTVFPDTSVRLKELMGRLISGGHRDVVTALDERMMWAHQTRLTTFMG